MKNIVDMQMKEIDEGKNIYLSYCLHKGLCARAKKEFEVNKNIIILNIICYNIKKGEKICYYPGTLQTMTKKKLTQISDYEYNRLIFINGKVIVKNGQEGYGEFLNHICRHRANVEAKIIQMRVLFIATRAININEDLSWEYNPKPNPIFEWTNCFCGEKKPTHECYIFCKCPLNINKEKEKICFEWKEPDKETKIEVMHLFLNENYKKTHVFI